MGKDMMSKIRAGDVWKAMARVLDEFRIEKEDFDVLDRRPHPQLTVRYCGQERMMSFPCTPKGHGRAPYRYSSRLRRLLKEMEIAAISTPENEETAVKQEQSLPLFAATSEHRGNQITMSSSEIAELVDSRHDKVKQSIERLAARGVIVQPPMGDEPETDVMGRVRVTKVYVFSGEQGKRDSIIVVAQLSPEFTARLVDRWQELEKGVASRPVITDFSDPRIMLGVLSHLQAKVAEQDGVIIAQGKRLETLDRIEGADGSMCITDAAKTLNKRPRDLTTFLSSRRWIYKRAGNKNWIAFQDRIQTGHLEHDEYIYKDGEGRERASTRVLVTQKGLVALAKLLDEPLH